MSNDNLVPEPQPSVFDAVNGVLQDEEAARRVMANPALAKGFPNGRPIEHSAASGDDTCACGGHHGKCGCQDDEQSDGSEIPIKAIDDIGRATAEDVREALHQIDELGRAIITMTLTTPACPLTDLIEDECASTLAGLVEEFRIDWTWDPRWTMERITPEGRDQLAALGFNFDNMPKY